MSPATIRLVVSAVSLFLLAVLLRGFGATFSIPGLGGGDDKEANVSISGALKCKLNKNPIINLNTEDRVETCVEAKRYAKSKLAETYKGEELERQFSCLDWMWKRESDWSAWARNPKSSAYGIAQILPSSHGQPAAVGDWKAQVDWGLTYINGRYKTACNAWAFWQCTSNCARYPGGPIGKRGGPGDPMRTWY